MIDYILEMSITRLESRVEKLEDKIEELINLLKKKQVIDQLDISLIEPESPIEYIGPL